MGRTGCDQSTSEVMDDSTRSAISMRVRILFHRVTRLETGQLRVETIVARIPLGVHGEVPQSLGMARHKSMPYAEVYGVPASSRTRPRTRLSSFPGRAAPQTESHQAQDKREKAIARLSEVC